jgi:putative MFS transporter
LEKITTHNGRESLLPLQIPKIQETALKKTRFQELFQGRYLSRTVTVWALWFCAYFVSYGLLMWIPTLFTSVFKAPLAQALRYGVISQAFAFVASLICAFTIDRVGRKPWLAFSFVGAFVPLLVLGARGVHSAHALAVLYIVYWALLAPSNMMLLLYTPEMYPTRMRGVGCGLASAWARIASIISPMVMAGLVSAYSISTVFVIMAVIPLVGAILTFAFAIETRGRVLEELAP